MDLMVDSKKSRKVARVLKKIGFTQSTKMADTLQGSIWRAKNKNKSSPDRTSVIKVTDQFLHKHSISAIIDNKIHPVKEDILLEQSILKYLTEQENCPKSIVKFQRFFQSKSSFFLVMEDGGSSLFDFVNNAHKIMRSKEAELCNWSDVVEVIFKQMLECIDYIHSNNVCHFDISLENFVINDIDVDVQEFGTVKKLKFATDDIQIKLCDFGLAQLFTNSNCISSKFCGKQGYKSPEVTSRKKGFDAKKNDIWGLGICLFSMVTGAVLWNVASTNNTVFKNVINGCLYYVLKECGKLNVIDDDVINLLQCIFQYELCRIDLKSIKQHQWIKQIE